MILIKKIVIEGSFVGNNQSPEMQIIVVEEVIN
jgi:hypothetical protein